MINREKLIRSAMTSFLLMAATQTITAAGNETAAAPTEKCYGVARAGMNDCATATASCAGSAVKDAQADAFLFVPQGLCDKLSGGKLQSKTNIKKRSKL